VATSVSSRALKNALLVVSLVGITAFTVNVPGSAVNRVSHVWRIVIGDVSILDVKESVVSCVIALVVTILALNI